MSARKRVPDDQVIRAIQRWRGNVTAAADTLGIAPINLRKRLHALGVDLRVFRRLKDTGIHGIPGRGQSGTASPISGASNESGGRNQSAAGICSATGRGTSLSVVSTDVLTRPRGPAPVRLTPDQVEVLREAKFELQYQLRAEVNESSILQQFFEDGFKDWLSMKLAPSVAVRKTESAKKPKTARRARTEGEDGGGGESE